MASPSDSGDDVFEALRSQVDPKIEAERQRFVEERVNAQYEKAQRRLAELVLFCGLLLIWMRC
ncbi:hypothetical protein F5884DRAFT_376568 [Xylogone sp. PMI_703]|nr:hypothetical protein F5884DRAFT_376568 [Xylogone sp. PMI_703]